MTPAQEKAVAVAMDGLREAFGDDLKTNAALLGVFDADLKVMVQDWCRLMSTSMNCPECRRYRGHNSKCPIGDALRRFFSLIEPGTPPAL